MFSQLTVTLPCTGPPGLSTSADEAAFVGGDHGLNAIPGAELREDVADVGLYGLHSEEQLGCDLQVGPALRYQPQDFGFAVGEVRLGEPAASRRAVAGGEPTDRGGEQQRLAAVDRADRVDEVVRGGAFEEEPPRSCLQRVVDVVVVLERGHHDDRGAAAIELAE